MHHQRIFTSRSCSSPHLQNLSTTPYLCHFPAYGRLVWAASLCFLTIPASYIHWIRHNNKGAMSNGHQTSTSLLVFFRAAAPFLSVCSITTPTAARSVVKPLFSMIARGST